MANISVQNLLIGAFILFVIILVIILVYRHRKAPLSLSNQLLLAITGVTAISLVLVVGAI